MFSFVHIVKNKNKKMFADFNKKKKFVDFQNFQKFNKNRIKFIYRRRWYFVSLQY